MKVTDTCRVPFSIGQSYPDEVTYDLVEMDTCHVFLERPWQYNLDAIYKGRDNVYLFWWHGKKIILVPTRTINPLQRVTATGGMSFLTLEKVQFMEEVKTAKTMLTLVVKESESISNAVIPRII
jgi:hypothetical protein